jgi:predicted nucleic acid-binding protein
MLFLDTSFIVALDNVDDPHHEHSVRLASALVPHGVILGLHWGILLELLDGYARLSRRARGIELLNRLTTQSIYEVFTITGDTFAEALNLFRTRSDKEWGLTDCVSFVLMRQLGITDALTADQHFVQVGFRALLLEESQELREG